MNDTFLDRETVKCGRCKLVQYVTPNRICRRCKLSVEMPMPAAAALPVAEPKVAAVPRDCFLTKPTIAEMVKELRLEREWSQRDLAKRMNVPRTYVSKIENGKATPILASMQKFADALGVDASRLLIRPMSAEEATSKGLLADPFIAEVAKLTSGWSGPEKTRLMLLIWDWKPTQQNPAA